MLRKSLPAIGIGLMLSSPVLPDIVNVTQSSSVSGSGSLSVACGIGTTGCEPSSGVGLPATLTVSYSFGPSSGGGGVAASFRRVRV